MTRSSLPATRRIPVIVNMEAGGCDSRAIRNLVRRLAATGCDADLRLVLPDCMTEAIDAVARDSPAILAIGGGDGSVRTAAERVAGHDTALAPLPLGTFNHFARRLGIEEVQHAADAIRAGRTARAPLGFVDDVPFLNTATFGIYAEFVRQRDRNERWLGRRLAIGLAMLLALVRFRSFEFELLVDGQSLRRSTPFLWIGVGRGSFPFALTNPLDQQPVLEVVLARSTGRWSILTLLARSLTRIRQGKAPHRDYSLETLHARAVFVDAEHEIGLTLDGDVVECRLPALVSIQPRALLVRQAVQTRMTGPLA